ncbi:MAG TPA: c-type cytochrome [Gammaproteobacteria bacterium]|nr:c-type cytochrome [Gammaproteobacteria bacterium]
MTTFVGVLSFLVLLAVVFFLIARVISHQAQVKEHAAAPNKMEQKITEQNIAPVAKVNVASSSKAAGGGAGASSGGGASASPTAARSGEQVFKSVCMTCHATGAAGAPIVGHKDLWGPRAKQGIKVLLSHAMHGYKGMPPKGTCSGCSEQEIKNAIEYMVITKTGLTIPGVSKPESGNGGQQAASNGKQTKAENGGGGGKTVAGFKNVDLAVGKKRFESTCVACHGSGVAGAPKFGNKSDWAPRIAQGPDTMLKRALSGYKGMPPKGTCGSCSKQEIKDAIAYMVSHSQ